MGTTARRRHVGIYTNSTHSDTRINLNRQQQKGCRTSTATTASQRQTDIDKKTRRTTCTMAPSTPQLGGPPAAAATEDRLEGDEPYTPVLLPNRLDRVSALPHQTRSSIMKEEDAAILERGVGDSCSSGRTPVLVPIRPPSTDDLPAMMSLSLPSNSGESSSTTKHANNAPLGGTERDAGSTIEGSSCCSQTVGDEHPTDSLFSRRISGFGDCSDLPSAPKDEGNKTQSGETTTTTTTTPAPPTTTIRTAPLPAS